MDSSYLPRQIITSVRAFVIAYKGNAEVMYEHPVTFGLVNKDLQIKKPSVIRVKEYIKQEYQKVPLTRENVFKRDGYACVYCGADYRKALTIDHVVPQSKGGPDSWENWVTACLQCNHEKADLTLEEYGKTIPQPKRPHYLMLMKQLDYIPDEWREYLFC